MARTVPLTLVTGFLGAGKTTAIRHWLGQRPAGERWAVLVNDFGLLAVDAAAFDGTEVFEVAGGCACCAAAVAMRATLGRILRRGPWDRVLVELSGLGHPASLVDRLREAARGTPLRIDGVVAIVDASRPGPWLETGGAHAELARDQVDCADAVVLTRTDDSPRTAALRAGLAAGPFGGRPVLDATPQLPAWHTVAGALGGSPPTADGGHGPAAVAPGGGAQHPAVADAPASASASAPPARRPPAAVALPGGGRRWARSTPDGFELAWHWPADTGFDRRAAMAWAREAAAAGTLLRGKGVFATRRDWYLWQHAAGEERWEPTAWRRDVRVTCLFADPLAPDALDALERVLLAARDASGGASGG